MKHYRKLCVILGVTTLMTSSLFGCGKGSEAQTEAPQTEVNADAVATTEEPVAEEAPAVVEDIKEEDIQLEGYNLLWHDEFSGDFDESKWNKELREPGWTNNELQEYTNSEENIFTKDGNLVLKAVKTVDENGQAYYTSGKVQGQNKTDFLYGKVVARAKVPEGQGLWPAIWMMPTDESLYGQWPKCGEIDIMEVLGHETNKAYQTVHYGEPHGEQQGTLTLENGTYASEYHDYSVEWEPGEIRWYIDDQEVLVVNDWFSAVQGEDDKPYPAPFDQTFFVQMNLAVGGDWPGNPDDTTDFDNAEFLIDYVRVYQKSEYDTNVSKPEKVFREPTEDGNLIYNGDFSDAEALDDDENWTFLLFNEGVGTAEIKDNTMCVYTENYGTVDYSVQLVQPDLPLYKGHKYKLTFDAYAAEERPIVIAVTAPTAGWIRYLSDTRIVLPTECTTFEFEFEMTEKDDNNGRLEFNMGGRRATADVYIQNVRIEEVK